MEQGICQISSRVSYKRRNPKSIKISVQGPITDESEMEPRSQL